jgi:alpha-amylase
MTIPSYFWADEERDISAWLGNALQQEAFNQLYSIAERVRFIKDHRIQQDWQYLQSSDHFFYMSTKRSSDGAVHRRFSPYASPLDAFINYMNVLSDVMARVRHSFPTSFENEKWMPTENIHIQMTITMLKKSQALKARKQNPSSEGKS